MANIDVTRIAGNIGALNALNALTSINNELAVHQTRLATGRRLNSAADDPAGMQMATNFDVRRASMQTALDSIGDAKNFLSTAEGGLQKIQDILVKMRGKAMQAKSDTMGANERTAVATQLNQYAKEINDIVDQTKWNDKQLLGASGSAGGAPTNDQFSFMTSANGDMTTMTWDQGFGAGGTGAGSAAGKTGLGLFTAGAQATGFSDADADATTNLATIDNAIGLVKVGITNLGVYSARMSFKEDALNSSYANTAAAYNRIMNANMAQEQVDSTKYSILQQTSTAMLAQANAAPQFLLSLFR